MLSARVVTYAMQNGMNIQDVERITQFLTEELTRRFRAERNRISTSLRKRGLCVRCAEESPDASLCDDCQPSKG